MAFFWSKQKSVESMLESYFERCDMCLKLFEQGWSTWCELGQGEAFAAAVQRTHEAESSADDLRREIELTLYGKALLPESRGDLLGLLEAFDKLPNLAETVLFALYCQRTVIPDDLLGCYQGLVSANLQAYYLTRKAVDDLFHNTKVTLHSAKQVDEKESECDRLERATIGRIFDSNLDMGMKMHLRDMVLLIGNLSDRAESVADRISIIAIKRNI